ncbi:hypothetical protein BJX64DRAFT_249053, partial [Aspergillus heterothallicus]
MKRTEVSQRYRGGKRENIAHNLILLPVKNWTRILRCPVQCGMCGRKVKRRHGGK